MSLPIVIAVVIAAVIVANAMIAFAFCRIARNLNRTPTGMPSAPARRTDAQRDAA